MLFLSTSTYEPAYALANHAGSTYWAILTLISLLRGWIDQDKQSAISLSEQYWTNVSTRSGAGDY